MKDFLKYTLATFTGLCIFCIIAFVFILFSIAGLMASSDEYAEIKDNSVLVLKINGEISDHTQGDGDIISQMKGEVSSSLGLDRIREAVTKAKENKNIKGIYIETGDISGSPATIQALHDLLVDFKTTKKFVVSYADSYSQAAYYVASAGDKVWINPQGMLSWHGMASQPHYLRDFLGKFGIKMQVVKVGQYKSATETYTEDHMSDANREQVSVYLNGIWNRFVSDVSVSRKISTDSLMAYADQVMDFAPATEYVTKHLVDGLLYEDEVKKEVKKLLKTDKDEEIPQIGIAQMIASGKDMDYDNDRIAIYYCEGSIVQEESEGLLMGDAGIVATKVCRNLEALANDDDVKAVVIRINSGGGSAYASEQMWHQIMELKKTKPVVVSMGGMCASGGYYMACGASWIVAEPTTLTGSIGIFGTFPDAHVLTTEKLGLKYDKVTTNKHSDMSVVPTSRPFSTEEIALLQKYINHGYATFTQRVADGRKMKKEEVEKIAQGRVWLGKDAINIRLVDQLGNIDVAIKKAATLAKLKDYSTCNYPVPKDWMESLMEDSGNESYLSEQMQMMLGDYYDLFSLLRNIRNISPVQALMEERVVFE